MPNRKKHPYLDYAICFDQTDSQITNDLTKPECDVGFSDILLSFLFFLNDSRTRALFISAGTNINKQIDLCRSPMEQRGRDAILQVCTGYFIFFSLLSIPKVFDCETFNRRTSSFISVTKIK